MSANQTPLAIPAAALQFARDAKAAGFTVKARRTSFDITVEVSKGDKSGYATWTSQSTGAYNRLGFASGGREGVRFSYASAHIGSKNPVVKSVAALKRALRIS
jgi:hypothetical protein